MVQYIRCGMYNIIYTYVFIYIYKIYDIFINSNLGLYTNYQVINEY